MKSINYIITIIFQNSFMVIRKYFIALIEFIKKYKVLSILIVGLIIRILIMPFFIHDDLAACYWRTYNIFFRNEWSHLLSLKFFIYIIHGIDIVFANLLIPNLKEIMNPEGISVIYYYPDMESFYTVWKEFLSSRNIYSNKNK